MKKKQIYRIVLLIGVSLFTSLIVSAQTVIAYVTVTAATAGKLKGGAVSKGNEGKIECTGFIFR